MNETVAIIPAYNEESTIGNVLSVLNNSRVIDQTVVVSDGSTDNTVQVSREFGANVIELEENVGKGGAMKAGLDNITADIILFLDADLIGLTSIHIEALLLPVINNEADMTVGIFEKGRIATDFAQKVAPYLSGQRAVAKKVLTDISDINMSRFGVEVALNRHIEENNIRVKEVILQDVSHVMKEEKFGVLRGFAARMKMYWEIVKYFAKKEVK
ncbi:glycosyltransferase family 2 protein [Natranaerobius thermophilus JW/NM-WN-LF]|uniref:Glucosyl-3-phosphoglycerate synthase n=1 Tax=Natranaerobius thermophilus (strain ATCC BAA-1301 / DSM 18059 / JW/NM-WN-LF) TaxID=457570 RepID=B2A391_NATTJ|nr:glycosyltransferase family 2 protein [Natranaerobius thermophilus]ACB85021.1 glycosyl transferase family 2 [Natranaerobius thermophilus JW/NM-WN-LF]